MAMKFDAEMPWHLMAVPRDEVATSIAQRFPHATGVFLHKAIWKHYVQQRSFAANWFTSTGARAISRHPLNPRDTGGNHAKIIQSFLEEGVYQWVSSKPLLVRSAPGAETWFAIGAGSRSDCFYSAKDLQPDNKYIVHAEESGLEDAVQLTDDIPLDVVDFLVADFNNFHEGNSNTIIQHMGEIPKIEKEFDAYKKKHGVTARTCAAKGSESYETRFWNFVSENKIWKKYMEFIVNWMLEV